MRDWLPFVGLLIAQLVILGLYALRQRAEDARRWHEKRLDAYSEFLRLAEDFRRTIDPDDPLGRGLKQTQTFASFSASHQQIALLGSAEVRDSASDLILRSLQALQKVREGELNAKDSDAEMIMGARITFVSRAREELGITSSKDKQVPFTIS